MFRTSVPIFGAVLCAFLWAPAAFSGDNDASVNGSRAVPPAELRARLASYVTENKRDDGFREISIKQLSKYVGKHVRLHAAGETPREGIISAVDKDYGIVRLAPRSSGHGGGVDIEIKMHRLLKAEFQTNPEAAIGGAGTLSVVQPVIPASVGGVSRPNVVVIGGSSSGKPSGPTCRK